MSDLTWRRLDGEIQECRVDDVLCDGISYVALLDVMGDQYTPAEDARTSTNKGRLGPEKDAALQARLMDDNHTSPFEGVVVKVEFMVPLFVLRELDRHRTLTKVSDEDELELVTPEESGRKWFARNEMSGRYIQMPDLYYHPTVIREQSQKNKQGAADSGAVSDEIAREFLERGRALCKEARALYDWGVANGIEKGLARIYNTQNQYTKIRLTGSLKNLFDFLSLRKPKVVLWECRQVARALEEILDELFPEQMAYWLANVYDTVRFNRTERKMVLDLWKRFWDVEDTRALDPVAYEPILRKLEEERD